MIITPAVLQNLKTSLKAEFQGAFDGAETAYEKIATTVPSTTAGNTYGWLGQFPDMREWVGDRVLKSMVASAYQIQNKDWESAIIVKRTDIEDDNLGIYKPLAAESGRAARVKPDQLVFELLKAGATTLCYDGQYFFDTDHPTYANVDGTGAVTTISNVTAGANPAWYLLDCSRAIKPLIYQNRKSAVFTAMTKDDDEEVFMRNNYRFGIDSRSNVGFGFWQMARKSQAELTAANLNAEYAAMASLKGDGGRVLGVRPTLLVAPPSLRTAALDIVKADRMANGATNINAGIVDVLITPWLL